MTDNPHQHRDHVTTYPHPGVAPEFHHYPVNKEPNANVQGDDINIPLVASSVTVSAILLFVLVTLLQAWYYNAMADEAQSKMEPSAPLMQMRTEQDDMLHKAHWVEKDHVAAISIDRAIDLTVTEYNGSTPEGTRK
jgi:hypothetical protein